MRTLLLSLVLSLLSFRTFAYCHIVEAQPGSLDGIAKETFERFAKARVYQLVTEGQSQSDVSVPMKYACSSSDHLVAFCIVSTVTELGTHGNFVFKVNRSPENVEVKLMEYVLD